MPASSRKRNKGKERKAKKLEIQRAKVRQVWWSFTAKNNVLSRNNCDHGYTLIPDDFDHPVSIFLDEFYVQLTESDKGMAVFKSTFNTHPQIWNESNNRVMLLDILVRIGTNMLLFDILQRHDDAEGRILETNLIVTRNVSEMILVLHEYGKTMNIYSAFNSRCVASKRLLLTRDGGSSSIRRDLLKFYRKRTSCSCLKKTHLKARKTSPKTGICFGCGEEKERASLSVCSKCKVGIGYCSRECQVAHWPLHKATCNKFASRAKQQQQQK